MQEKPDDEFYDAGDELGIIVSWDMMVVCVTIQNIEQMKASFEAEVYDNLAGLDIMPPLLSLEEIPKNIRLRSVYDIQ